MKKVLTLLLFAILLTGCSLKGNSKDKVSTLPTGFSYIFEKYDKSKGFETIYELPDGRKIISEFKKIGYKNNESDNEEISLEEALDKNIITIEHLIEQMTFVTAANDGGSKIYKFTTSEDVWLVSCNTLDGNKNIIIGTNKYIADKCVDY